MALSMGIMFHKEGGFMQSGEIELHDYEEDKFFGES